MLEKIRRFPSRLDVRTRIFLFVYACILAVINYPAPVLGSTSLGSGWHVEQPVTGYTFYDNWVAPTGEVYAVGDEGAVYKYDGTSWRPMDSGIDVPLHGVWGFSASDVFAVGLYGTVIHWDGTSWTAMATGTENGLYSIHGTASNSLFAVGALGTVLKYNGSSWSSITSGVSSRLDAVWCASATDVFAAGQDGIILRYDGSSWTPMDSTSTEFLEDLWGFSASDVYAVGRGLTLLHYDGTGWLPVETSTMDNATSHYTFTSVWGVGPTDLYVAEYLRIHHFDGTDWTTVWYHPDEKIGGYFFRIRSIFGITGSTVYAAGGNGSLVEFNGSTWEAMSPLVYTFWEDIWGFSEGDVFVVGTPFTGDEGNIMHYDGNGWESLLHLDDAILLAVWGAAPDDVYAGGQTYGELGYMDELFLLHYDGLSWSPVDLSAFSACCVFDIWGTSGASVYVATDVGILHYNGTEWAVFGSIGNRTVWGSSDDDIFAGGRHYDGTGWTDTNPDLPPGAVIFALWGSSGNDVYAVVNDYSIPQAYRGLFHYDGTSWNEVDLGFASYDFDSYAYMLKGVWGSSPDDVYVVGEYGVLLHYDGSSWTLCYAESGAYNLEAVWGTSRDNVYVTTRRPGYIYHYSGASAIPSYADDDFNKDGKPDLLWRNASTGQNYVWFMDGISYAGGAVLPTVANTDWEIAVTEDLNGDGNTDLLWRNYSTGQNYIWYMDGVVYVSGQALQAVPDLQWRIVGSGDFNIDGKPDIVWRHYGTGANCIWHLDGGTVLSSTPVPTVTDMDWDLVGVGILRQWQYDGRYGSDLMWSNSVSGGNVIWTLEHENDDGVPVWKDPDYLSLPGRPGPAWRVGVMAEMHGSVDSEEIIWRNASTGENLLWYHSGVRGEDPFPTVSDTNWQLVD